MATLFEILQIFAVFYDDRDNKIAHSIIRTILGSVNVLYRYLIFK